MNCLSLNRIVGVWAFATLLVFGWASQVFATTNLGRVTKNEILGVWKYIGFIYEDHFYQPPNPNLFLSFTFFENDQNRLFWEQKGEPGFCERYAKFSVDENSSLSQEVVWVNPNNKAECGKDSDMQLGRKTTNYVEIKDNQLRLFLLLNGKDFIYLLSKIPEPGIARTNSIY